MAAWERTDAGLSDFGIRLIKAMNRAGIAVDLSHTGIKTTLDAMDVSEKPVVFSHSLARAVRDSPRNLTDEQIRRVAEMSGVIGINGFPPFVADTTRPTLDDLLKHVDYMADLVGIDHIGIGIDFEYIDESMQATSLKHYNYFVKTGQWNPADYPPPPYYYPRGLDDPRSFPNLTKALLERGYNNEETKKVLGGNFMRVYSTDLDVNHDETSRDTKQIASDAGQWRCHYRRGLQRRHCGQVRGTGRRGPDRVLQHRPIQDYGIEDGGHRPFQPADARHV